MRLRGTLKNVFTVGSFTALSRVLGLVREMLQSRLVGAGIEQSAFTLAFAIPNMSRKLFGEGALTAAFVPVFKGEVEREGLERAEKLARAVITMMMLMLAAVLVLVFIGMSFWTSWFADAMADSYRLRTTVRLVAILLPYMLAICGAAFGMGVLNALGKFRAASFMPALLNVVWIAALVTLMFLPTVSLSARVTFIAVAILIGGFLQFGFMIRCMVREGIRPWPSFSGWRSDNVRLVWRNTAIAAVGAGAVQINYMLDQVLAQCASPWAAGVIGYAERLMDLPLGIVGVAFGTVLLPTFAGFFAQGDHDGARKALVFAIEHLFFVMVPAAAGMFVLAPEITAVIYEGNAFDSIATVRVSRALAVYALGLGFFGFQKALIPWFQAQNDMRTPLRVSLCTVILNAILNVLAVALLPMEWRHVGLAASTDICAAAGCVLLATLARRRNGSLGLHMVSGAILRILFSSAVMVAAVMVVRVQLLCFGKLAALGGSVIIGSVTYFLISLMMRKFDIIRKI